MSITWNDSWATGNATIDTQHKQLFKAINDLMAACSSGQGKEHLDSTLHFLISYTAKHFGDEERLQQQHHYPDYPNHKKLHEGFTASVAELAKQLQAQGPTSVLVAKVSSSTGGWLINHICREDKKVAAHIHSQGG